MKYDRDLIILSGKPLSYDLDDDSQWGGFVRTIKRSIKSELQLFESKFTRELTTENASLEKRIVESVK